jgi:adenine-specific DNA-methyltransferase
MPIKKEIEQKQKVQPNTELLQTLETALPQYFDANGKFKLDKFESELKQNNISEARDGYRLGFVGKDYARFLTGQSSETVIAPDINHNSKNENINSDNVFITGDNLEALRHLQNSYSGKIRLIYIDPPYNTGQEFVYNDKFEFTDEQLKSALGFGESEMERLKSIQGKSSHSAWLTFMYPRIKLANKLLSSDGIILISIDDNEFANLKLLVDDVFGESNFIETFIWESIFRPSNMSNTVRKNGEYVLCFSKKKIPLDLVEREQDPQGEASLTQNNNKPRELIFRKNYVETNLEDGIYKPGKYGDVTVNSEIVVKNRLITNEFKLNGKFKWSQEYLDEEIGKGCFLCIKGQNFIPYYRKDYQQTKLRPTKILPNDLVGDVLAANAEINQLFLTNVFSYPKPTSLMKYFFKTFKTTDGDIILDFFAGSSSTAHAVMQLNAEDNKKRKYIMVQCAETTNPNSEARNSGFETIDALSRERIIRAAQKIRTDNPMLANSLDLGFKHYRLIEPDVKTVNKIFEFDPNSNKLFEDDMITPFEYKPSGTNGLQTILQTWLSIDGYDFNIKVDNVKLSKYDAQYVRETAVLYLIDNGFSKDAMKALLNKIGKNEIAVNTLIVYPYSFSFEQMRELKNNLKNNLEQQVTIIERY